MGNWLGDALIWVGQKIDLVPAAGADDVAGAAAVTAGNVINGDIGKAATDGAKTLIPGYEYVEMGQQLMGSGKGEQAPSAPENAEQEAILTTELVSNNVMQQALDRMKKSKGKLEMEDAITNVMDEMGIEDGDMRNQIVENAEKVEKAAKEASEGVKNSEKQEAMIVAMRNSSQKMAMGA